MAVRGAFPGSVIDAASNVFAEIIDHEREHGMAGDHFSAAGKKVM